MWKEALSIEKGDELCALVMLTQKGLPLTMES